MRLSLLIFFAVTTPAWSLWAAEATITKPAEFLKYYCLDCHNSEDIRKGERHFDDLPLFVGTDLVVGERWQEVLHQLQLGEMPPADELQPTDVERRTMIEWIEKQLITAQESARSAGGRVVHRRLNRAEYLHTVQDLFGFQGDFDPTIQFPSDQEVEGFRNIGSALRTSRQHLEQYLSAADSVLDHAYDLAEVDGSPRISQWRDTPATWETSSTDPAFGLGLVTEENTDGPAYIHLRHGLRNRELIYDSKLFLQKFGEVGVTHSGWYEVEFEATAANRHHPYGDDLMLGLSKPYYPDMKSYYDQSQPMQLGIGRQGPKFKDLTWRLVPPNMIHAVVVPDNRYEVFKARIWLDRGTVPYLSWMDGPPKGTASNFISTKLYKYDSRVPKIEQHVWENLALRAVRDKLYTHLYKGPEIRLRYWQMTGPLREGSSHPARRLLFVGIAPEETKVTPERVEAELIRVASRLFRRDVESADVAPFREALLSRLDGNVRYADAARPVFKALLCSSEFLFLTETAPAASPKGDSQGEPTPASPPMVASLSAHQLAARLSYFLAAGPPDESLRALVAEGALDPTAIRRETDRMLDSPRGDRFLRLFTAQWLGLNKLGAMPPSQETFSAYHIDRLETAMKEETWRFIAELIRTNQTVTAIVGADFTYLNAALARHYELAGVAGDEFRRVSLPTDWKRPGILGQASVLTVSANGVETSPVTRGVWLLEKVFGTPPKPPPPDVPPLEPDIRGAKTIRQQLEKHRSVQACADCHAKIDPLGYSLEAFDPIGKARQTYPNGLAIDSAGEYRGQPVNSPSDVRDYLLKHPDLLAHNIAHRLLTYALGRQLGFADQPQLRAILADWKAQGHGLRTLVHLVASSDLMRSP